MRTIFLVAERLACFRRLVTKQVGNNDGCVINHLLFLHPTLTGLLHEDVNGICRCIFSLGHLDCILIVYKLPQSVCGNHKKPVRLRIEFPFGKLGIGNDTGSVRNGVTKRPRQIEKEKNERQSTLIPEKALKLVLVVALP